jgi:hypothetical protein
VTTFAELDERIDAATRWATALQVISPDCPLCGAVAGDTCWLIPGVTAYLLDQPHELYSHDVRIRLAHHLGTFEVPDGWTL